MFEQIVHNISSSVKDSGDQRHTSAVNLIPFSNNDTQVILPLKYKSGSIPKSEYTDIPISRVSDYTTKIYIFTLSLFGIFIVNSVLKKNQR